MEKYLFKNNPIITGIDIWEKLEKLLFMKYYLSKNIIIVDENSCKYCLPIIENLEQLSKLQIIQINSGEKNKNIETVNSIWEKLTYFEADRKSVLINLGGGVIGDLGGFAASTFKRGIDFINIPTTLLSQVDASIGGKTGIDFVTKEGKVLKNQVGVFKNPKAVFIFPGFLKTLNQREILCGWAEIIKHALISDNNYWKEIKNNFLKSDLSSGVDYLYPIILRSIKIKKGIVLEDPYEKGFRKVLNFGHTIGHALESFSLENDKNPLLHGEAVAIGIICEAFISSKICGLKSEELDDISSFIRDKYIPYKMNKKHFPYLISLMKSDKKNEKGVISFSLLPKIGNCIVNQNCGESIILDSLKFYFSPS